MYRSLAVAFLLVGASACGGSSSESARTEPGSGRPIATSTLPLPPPPPRQKALPGLPRYTAGYDRWTKLNRKPIPPRESGDAHLGRKNVYASREREANGDFPRGTILVKEATRPGRDFVGLIAVMRKEQDADPAHHDWVFVEYTRDGRNERFTETAGGAVCWTCHMGAEKTDYVWIYSLDLAR